MAQACATTSLASTSFPARQRVKVTIRVPPKLRTHPAVGTRCLKREYRQKKSELTAELLHRLWHRSPADYDFEREVELAWNRHITPLVRAGQLDATRAQKDMYMHMDV